MYGHVSEQACAPSIYNYAFFSQSIIDTCFAPLLVLVSIAFSFKHRSRCRLMSSLDRPRSDFEHIGQLAPSSGGSSVSLFTASSLSRRESSVSLSLCSRNYRWHLILWIHTFFIPPSTVRSRKVERRIPRRRIFKGSSRRNKSSAI